jgi:hypothetical protein
MAPPCALRTALSPDLQLALYQAGRGQNRPSRRGSLILSARQRAQHPSPMSAIFATQVTAIATIVLAVGAIAKAALRYAFRYLVSGIRYSVI